MNQMMALRDADQQVRSELMGVYIRTGRNSGVSVPWIAAIFVLPIAAIYWMLLLCFIVVKVTILLSIQFYLLIGKALVAVAERRRRD